VCRDAEDCTFENANFVPTGSPGAKDCRVMQAIVNPSGTNELGGVFALRGGAVPAAL
jgi:hypothetical protein